MFVSFIFCFIAFTSALPLPMLSKNLLVTGLLASTAGDAFHVSPKLELKTALKSTRNEPEFLFSKGHDLADHYLDEIQWLLPIKDTISKTTKKKKLKILGDKNEAPVQALEKYHVADLNVANPGLIDHLPSLTVWQAFVADPKTQKKKLYSVSLAEVQEAMDTPGGWTGFKNIEGFKFTYLTWNDLNRILFEKLKVNRVKPGEKLKYFKKRVGAANTEENGIFRVVAVKEKNGYRMVDVIAHTNRFKFGKTTVKSK